MYCTKCGAKIPDHVTFCPQCGAPAGATGSVSAAGRTDRRQTYQKYSPAKQTLSGIKGSSLFMAGSTTMLSRVITLVCGFICFIGSFMPWYSLNLILGITIGGSEVDKAGHSALGVLIALMAAVIIALHVFSFVRHQYDKRITIASTAVFAINLIIMLFLSISRHSSLDGSAYKVEAGIYLIVFASIIGLINEIILIVREKIR